ncbi:helix-turn-helix domain-containing protein [Micromonospora sp. SH-82]|uniref:helix-turn-helix domain-containing protein n=1 Tax=Micromonospora sp. SH-82 TaxID=3132938 RepID=UPI003EBB6859
MPARIRTIVDPQFPTHLSRLRTRCGMSLRDLARHIHCSKSYVHDLESGRARPTRAVATQLDRVLQAAGVLAAMVVDTPAVTTPDDDQRIAYVAAHPTRLDVQTVALLADVLAAQRRLDDVVAATLMLPSAVPQWRVTQDLAAEAQGQHATELRAIAAEWTQFVGWLRAEARHDAEAVRVLIEAADQADAVGSGVLAAQAENFRGYVERQRGNARGIVRHFLAAYQTPGASPLQRIGDGVQAAHGYALLGDRNSAERLLHEASDLTEQADSEVVPPSAYWLTPTFGRMNIGLAHLALGNATAAADNLQAGLGGLPFDQRDAEWAQEYWGALTTASS